MRGFRFARSHARSRSTHVLLAAVALAALPAPARAAELIWDGNGAAPLDGGAGTWNTSLSNWWNGAGFVSWDNSAADAARFAGTAGPVTLASGLTARGLTFDSNGYTLSGNGSLTLVSAGSGGPGPQTIAVAAGTSATIDAGLFASALNKTGDGTLTLNTLTGLSGSVSASSGTLALGSGTLNATLAGAGTIVKNGFNTLTLTQSSASTGRFILARRRLNLAAPGAIGSGTFTVAGSDASLSWINSQSSTTLSNAVEMNGPLTIFPASFGSGIGFAGKVTGTGTMRLDGVNDQLTVSLSGNNAGWTGGLDIAHGRLVFSAGAALPSGHIAVGNRDFSGNYSEASLLGSGTFTHGLGFSAGQVDFNTGVNNPFGGPPSRRVLGASGGTLHVNFGGTATPASITWGQSGFWGDGVMTLDGGAATDGLVLLNPIDLGSTSSTRTISASGAGSIVLQGGVSGSGSLALGGSGTVALPVANSFTGNLVLGGGTVLLQNAAAIPPGAMVMADIGSSTLVIGSGLTASVNGLGLDNPSVITGSGVTIDASAGTLLLDGDINNPPVNTSLGVTFTLKGNIDLGDSPRTWNTTHSNVYVDGPLRGSASIDVPGTGDVRLRGQNFNSGGMSFHNRAVYVTTSSIGPAGAPTSGPFGTGAVTIAGPQYLIGGMENGKVIEIANPFAIAGSVQIQSMRFTGPVDFGDAASTIQTYDSSLTGDYKVYFAGPLSSGPAGGLNIIGQGTAELLAANPGLLGPVVVGTDQTSTTSPAGHAVVRDPLALGSPSAGTTVKRTSSLLIDADITGEPITLDSSGTISTGWGSPTLVITPGHRLTGDIHYNGNVFVQGDIHGQIIDDTGASGGTLALGVGSTVNRFSADSLIVHSTVTLRPQLQPLASRFRQISFFNVAPNKLDLTGNAAVVDYDAGSSSFAAMRDLVLTGRNGGDWNGTKITSSLAASDPARYAVGIAEAADVISTFPATFLGQPIDSTSVLIRATLDGDANLDGTVDTLDFNSLAAHFGATDVLAWSQGDFNYDGKIDTLDFNALAANFGRQFAAPENLPQALGAPVPEPALTLPALLLLALHPPRRRRRP